MQFKAAWHWTVKVAVFVGLVVMALNIEKVSQGLGLDNLLGSILGYAPAFFQSIWHAVTSPTAFYISTLVVAYGAGLWTESGFRKLVLHNMQKLDPKQLAEKCEIMAKAVRVNADLFNSDSKLEPGYLTMISLDLWSIEEKLAKIADAHVVLGPKDPPHAKAVAQFLDDVAKLLRTGDIAGIRDRSHSIIPEDQSPLLLPSAAEEKRP